MGALLVVGAAGGCASDADPPGAAASAPASATGLAAAGQATPIPGVDPAIQRWFLSNDAAKIAFNNALLRAQRGVASGKAAECQPLSAAAEALGTALPKLTGLSPAGQKLAATIQPVMTTFSSAAAACLARNFPAAQTALDAGVVQQADAQETIDEILDGDL